MIPEILTKIASEFSLEESFEEFVFGITRFNYHQTGSSFTCDPPVLDTDFDWICNLTGKKGSPDMTWRMEDILIAAGHETSENQEHYPDYVSYRKDNINIIVVYDEWMYRNWIKATTICKRLNLLEKEDRKMVHRISCGEEQ
jgi:hypothetical protein